MANTISAAIVEIFDELGFTIHTNHISDGTGRYGIFRSPARVVQEQIDGSHLITEAYQFFGRLDSLSETEREDADAAHLQKCQAKLDVLLEQQVDLSTAIDQLLEDIEAGHKYMKVYRQMKMYNDPATNPVLYKK